MTTSYDRSLIVILSLVGTGFVSGQLGQEGQREPPPYRASGYHTYAIPNKQAWGSSTLPIFYKPPTDPSKYYVPPAQPPAGYVAYKTSTPTLNGVNPYSLPSRPRSCAGSTGVMPVSREKSRMIAIWDCDKNLPKEVRYIPEICQDNDKAQWIDRNPYYAATYAYDCKTQKQWQTDPLACRENPSGTVYAYIENKRMHDENDVGVLDKNLRDNAYNCKTHVGPYPYNPNTYTMGRYFPPAQPANGQKLWKSANPTYYTQVPYEGKPDCDDPDAQDGIVENYMNSSGESYWYKYKYNCKTNQYEDWEYHPDICETNPEAQWVDENPYYAATYVYDCASKKQWRTDPFECAQKPTATVYASNPYTVDPQLKYSSYNCQTHVGPTPASEGSAVGIIIGVVLGVCIGCGILARFVAKRQAKNIEEKMLDDEQQQPTGHMVRGDN